MCSVCFVLNTNLCESTYEVLRHSIDLVHEHLLVDTSNTVSVGFMPMSTDKCQTPDIRSIQVILTQLVYISCTLS